MSDGVLYKSNGSTWTKSQAKRFDGVNIHDGVVKHSNGTTWYDNYPMEQLFTQKFNMTWCNGYNGSGVKLDPATWGDQPRSGGSANFQGLWGFDNTAMKSFVSNGVIQYMKFTCKFIDPSHSGNPTVNFVPHTYKSKPTSYSGTYENRNYKATSQFVQTGGDIIRTISLPVAAWLSGNFGGVGIYGTTAAADSALFAGSYSFDGHAAYTATLEIQVLK